MIQTIIENLAAPVPRSTSDGLTECRFLVSFAVVAVVALAIYLGLLGGQFNF